MMKKSVPIFFGVAVGLFAFAEFYIPYWKVGWLRDELFNWAVILSAFAFVLGGVNLVQVNYPKIRRRERDWGYKVVMVASAVVMAVCGIKWHKVFSSPATSTLHVAQGGPPDKARVHIDAPDDVLVKIGATAPVPARDDAGKPLELDVAPGDVTIVFSRRMAGYEDLTTQLEVKAGEVATISGDPQMLWGTQGRVYVWLYDHVFAPCNSTMFALLAFFVASAAFRAFRMRNLEATLLLGAAIIVMLAAAPIGAVISEKLGMNDDLLDIKQWILDIPNNGGRRAIMMGAAIGAIATSLRIILGIERSHIGAD